MVTGTINEFINLTVKIGQTFGVNQPIAHQILKTKSAGIIEFSGDAQNQEIKLIESSAIIENGVVNLTEHEDGGDKFELITPDGNKLFNLTVSNGDLLTHGQTLASLEDSVYQTETGGILYYSIENAANKKKRNTKQLFKGLLYWIPEETHKYNPKTVLVTEGSFIKRGSTIDPNTISNTDGFISFDRANSEIIIKPGELYELKDSASPFL